MNIFNILLSGEVLFGLGAAISLAIVLRALTGFLGEAAELRVRLENVQELLDKSRESLPEKKEQLEEIEGYREPGRQGRGERGGGIARRRDPDSQTRNTRALKEKTGAEICQHGTGDLFRTSPGIYSNFQIVDSLPPHLRVHRKSHLPPILPQFRLGAVPIRSGQTVDLLCFIDQFGETRLGENRRGGQPLGGVPAGPGRP